MSTCIGYSDNNLLTVDPVRPITDDQHDPVAPPPCRSMVINVYARYTCLHFDSNTILLLRYLRRNLLTYLQTYLLIGTQSIIRFDDLELSEITIMKKT